LIKLCKNSKIKWRDGSGFEAEVDVVIPYSYPTFDYREKSKPEHITDQLGYYPSKSGKIPTDAGFLVLKKLHFKFPVLT